MRSLLIIYMFFILIPFANATTKYIKKGSSIALTAGECCSDWSKTGNCITISPNDTKCLISGNSTGTATVEVRDTRDNTICSTYNIVVYEAKINEVIGDIADGARKTISVNFSPTSLTVDEVNLEISKPDNSNSYNNPANAGSTINGSKNDWTIPNARWYQGSNECTFTATYKISGTYKLDNEVHEFEAIYITVNAGGDYVNGESRLERWYTGYPNISVEQIEIGDSIMYRASVTGVGNFTRSMLASVSTAPTLSTSQYYNMVLAEENYHKKQWEGTVSSPIKSNLHFLPSNVMAAISNFYCDASDGSIAKNMLMNAINNEIYSEEMRSFDLVTSFSGLRCQLEREAKIAINATHLSRIQCAYEGLCN